MVFTTLSSTELSTRDVLELYRVRWQIELRFKHLKSILGFGCLPKYDDGSCRAWIQAKLLCGLLIERLSARGRAKANSYQSVPQPLAAPLQQRATTTATTSSRCLSPVRRTALILCE